jgi:thiamine-monophosphate kinase
MTNSTSDPRPGEFELIAKLFAPLANSPGAFNLADDAAIVSPPDGAELVVTTDALVEGVHFRHDDPPDLIAKKALRVNLSDLAAKGAVPLAYLLVLALPEWPDGAWLESFARGLKEDQTEFSLSLIGGDTTATPGPLTIAITAFGHVPHGTMIRRAGARAGDLVFVSGTIGDAGAGLAVLKGDGALLARTDRDALIFRYRQPMLRAALGQALRGLADAALDVSDGLAADLGHIADVSRVRVRVEALRIPLSTSLRALWGDNLEARVRAAVAGDDYEIAFTAPPQNRPAILEAAAAAGVPVSEIGQVEAGGGVVLVDGGGSDIPVPRKGFVHF